VAGKRGNKNRTLTQFATALSTLQLVLSNARGCYFLIADQKSILTDNDWKKLWMRGGINGDSKLDNNLDSSDSPMFEDSEVSPIDRLRSFSVRPDLIKCYSKSNLN